MDKERKGMNPFDEERYKKLVEQDKKLKAYMKAYMKAYRQRPEVKAYQKAYNQTYYLKKTVPKNFEARSKKYKEFIAAH